MHPLVVTSLSLVVEDIFWKVPVHFINCCSADSCDFGVLMRGGKLRVFSLCHLSYLFASFLTCFLIQDKDKWHVIMTQILQIQIEILK